MKIIVCCVFLALFVATVSANCHVNKIKCYEHRVNKLLNQQIAVELGGHYTYLYLSHLFQQQNNYYPKVAKYFRAKSDEEMEHAEKFIAYQNQRGGTFEIGPVTRKSDGACALVDSLKKGFSCAKQLEIDVTRELTTLLANVTNVIAMPTSDCIDTTTANKDLILAQAILVTTGGARRHLKLQPCSDSVTFTDVEYVELAEMIAHEFLGHQLVDTKELANFEATLNNFNDANEKLGSFLADKHFDL